jgi:5-methylcytosine-specific restriction endonuclease McrA
MMSIAEETNSLKWCQDTLLATCRYQNTDDNERLFDIFAAMVKLDFRNMSVDSRLRAIASVQIRLLQWKCQMILDGHFQATSDEKLEALRTYEHYGLDDDPDNMPYTQYLKSDHWKAIRSIALEIAEHKCQLCGSDENLNVHHRSYKYKGDEHNHMSDVIVLCNHCHAKFHDKLPKG